MARPKKPITEKLQSGTYRKDRDSKTKVEKNIATSKYEVIKKKLLEVETLIQNTKVSGNERLLINLSLLYQKLVTILEAPSFESKEPKQTNANIMDQLIKNKKN